MQRTFLLLASVFGFFGVALGAFGAHGLKKILSPEMLLVFETGVRYQMYHTFAILVVALFVDRYPALKYSGRLFGAGIVLFSGSLYVLALTGIPMFGAVTPFGGICFLAGWVILGATAFKIQTEN
jgi:uncharacterized membrane protein YgdD (TMEM256/DUF423 family)